MIAQPCDNSLQRGLGIIGVDLQHTQTTRSCQRRRKERRQTATEAKPERAGRPHPGLIYVPYKPRRPSLRAAVLPRPAWSGRRRPSCLPACRTATELLDRFQTSAIAKAQFQPWVLQKLGVRRWPSQYHTSKVQCHRSPPCFFYQAAAALLLKREEDAEKSSSMSTAAGIDQSRIHCSRYCKHCTLHITRLH